ncbi:MAG: hypothetical protein OEW89_09235 [Gammaproteobacteria bacterium]|nr:hypothetical protein [Gammaproteobacteria bacterium]MDH5594877.1 hypothetical protein [Gammaproteobacteria bacterium]MDH5614878.1 hypothetical protein [Gammaproteobacteria bacterium]
MKKSNKEKMKTARLMEKVEDIALQSHADHSKKTSEDIQKRVSRLIEKWEEEDWKQRLESKDDFEESIHYEWGNNTRH